VRIARGKLDSEVRGSQTTDAELSKAGPQKKGRPSWSKSQKGGGALGVRDCAREFVNRGCHAVQARHINTQNNLRRGEGNPKVGCE